MENVKSSFTNSKHEEPSGGEKFELDVRDASGGELVHFV